MGNECPVCGAVKHQFYGSWSWQCGSYNDLVPGPEPNWVHVQSAHCRCRVELAKLVEENSSLRSEQQRLVTENAALKVEQRRLADMITERNSDISELEAQVETLNDLQSEPAALSADAQWEEELRALLLGWRARAMNERAYGVDEDATPSLKCSEELASVLQRNTTTKTT